MTPPALSAQESEAVLTHIVRSEDLNMYGSLFGGKMLAFMDTCAAISALRHSGYNCVTARISDVDFLAPVHLGHILTLRARVIFTARSSMDIEVEAKRENHISDEIMVVCRATFTFVAIGEDNQPAEIPPVIVLPEDQALHEESKQRYLQRKKSKGKTDEATHSMGNA